MGKIWPGMNLPRRLFVTGGSEGIGYEIAKLWIERLNQSPNNHLPKIDELVLVARNTEKLFQAKVQLESLGYKQSMFKIITRSVDLSDLKQLEDLAREVESSLCVGLVNNAGGGLLGKFEQLDRSAQLGILDLNIRAPVVLSHAFMNAKRQPGSILIQVSSGLGFIPHPAQAVYSATKAFLNSFSESLEFRARDLQIQLVNLCPGATKTQFRWRAGGDRSVPVSRWDQTPDQVAKECLDFVQRGGRGAYVSGWHNRWLLRLVALLPRKIGLWRMARLKR